MAVCCGNECLDADRRRRDLLCHGPRRLALRLHPSGGAVEVPRPGRRLGLSDRRRRDLLRHGPRRLALRPPPQRGRTVEVPRPGRRLGLSDRRRRDLLSPWAPTARSTTSTPSGGELWKFPAPAGGSAYRIDGGVTSFRHGPRRLALRPPPQRGRTGQFPAPAGGSAYRIDGGVTSFAMGPDGSLYDLHPSGGELWKFPRPGRRLGLSDRRRRDLLRHGPRRLALRPPPQRGRPSSPPRPAARPIGSTAA